jgi:hypothetical protein
VREQTEQKKAPPAPATAKQRTTPKRLTPEAQRALAEAAARRGKIDARVKPQPKELNGRDGPDPVRYGDWEKNGIASDF